MVTMAFVLYLLVIIFVFKKKFYFSLSFCSRVFSRRGKIITIVLLLNLKSENKTPVRGLLADPIPNSPNSLRKNCIADSKDNN